MKKFSFKNGYSQVRQIDAPVVRERIMNALGLNSRMAWWQRLNGLVEPRVTEAEAIGSIFAEYGVTDVWGDESNESAGQIN